MNFMENPTSFVSNVSLVLESLDNFQYDSISKTENIRYVSAVSSSKSCGSTITQNNVSNSSMTSANNELYNEPSEETVKTAITIVRRAKRRGKPATNIKRSKRQMALNEQYRKMSRCLKILLKRQKKMKLCKKADREKQAELVQKIRHLLKNLRKKLHKKDYLERLMEFKRRKHLQRVKMQQRLKKILRVVYFKRKQRIHNMRLLRVRERKRLANSLMLEAARLRARANRLTGGYQHTKQRRTAAKRQRKLTKNENLVSAEILNPTPSQEVQLNANANETSLSEEQKKVIKKPHKPKLTPNQKKQKALDNELHNLNAKLRIFLIKLGTYSKKPHIKVKPVKTDTSECKETVSITTSNATKTTQKSEKSQKSKHKTTRKPKTKRKFGTAWWRKNHRRYGKVFREKPKLDDFGSDTDVYDMDIESITTQQSSVLKEN